MSFGGSVQGMISSLKSNGLPKRRHSILSKEKELTASGVKGDLKFIEVSETELLKIKEQIRKDAIRRRIRNLIILLPFILLMIFVLISIVKDYQAQQLKFELLRIEQQKQNESAQH